MTWREWTVASGVIEGPEGLLLVRNQRRGGFSDWSTPGGVIDEDDADVLTGLTREVREETGLQVLRWEGPLYEVRAVAPDLEWVMHCEVFYAAEYEGVVVVDDPDGIVVDAIFVPTFDVYGHLRECMQWVREPLVEWLTDRWEPQDTRRFHFEVRGTARDDLQVSRGTTS